MKFSIRQILASVVGAVLAAVIASAFGVKGTIVGVAIGSAAATIGTALVAQSIERGHEAVRQVVVRAPEDSVLRKLGGTAVGGASAASVDESSVPTEAVASAAASGAQDVTDETAQMDASGCGVRAHRAARGDARRRGHRPPSGSVASASAAPVASRRFTWKAIAGTAGVVFLAALLFVTVVELIAGKPLASIFGHAGTGTTLGGVVNGTPPAPATTRRPRRRDHDVVDQHDHDEHDPAVVLDDEHDRRGARRPPRPRPRAARPPRRRTPGRSTSTTGDATSTTAAKS